MITSKKVDYFPTFNFLYRGFHKVLAGKFFNEINLTKFKDFLKIFKDNYEKF
jgi:hypothetical protein